jgi:hypothetical protein
MEAKQLDAANAQTTRTSASPMMMTASDSPIDPGGTNTGSGGGTYTNNYQPLVFGSNDFWIQLTNVDEVNQQASLILHGTVPDDRYQLLSTNVLSSDGLTWTLGDYIIIGAAGTNQTPVTANIGTNPQLFFWAHHANPVLAIFADTNAIAPNPATGDPGQAGDFLLQCEYPLTNDLTVYYSMSGASNGVDYDYLNGVATLSASDQPSTNIIVIPTANNRMQGDKTVTLTLLQTNDYLIDPNYTSASITILDSYTLVGIYEDQPVAYRPDGPPGVPAQPGIFQFSRHDQQNNYAQMTAYYTITGTGRNGVDFSFLSNSIVFPAGSNNVYLDVNPLSETVLQGVKTVTVTLFPTNGYFVDTNATTQTVQIFDTSTTISIVASQPDATETNGAPPGVFDVTRTDDRNDFPPLTVYYTIGGTASGGVDYQTLPGTVTFADGTSEPVIGSDTNTFVQTIQDNRIDGDETVILTLNTNGNAYEISETASNATVTIHDSVYFILAATNLPGIVGIEYDTITNSLLISYHFPNGSPTFARVYTNITSSGGVTVTNVLATNWSGIGGLQDEVYLTTARIPVGTLTNSAGFTNGDVFFGSGSGIGWLSPDATSSNLDWCILTNSVVTNQLTLRGGICMDETGTFSNQIIAVTSPSNPDAELKGIWRVNSHAQSTLIAQINTPHLEGVAILTNDVAKWGPWAGTIITGDESHQDANNQPDPTIYAIAPNGNVTTNETLSLISSGIYPEDFKVIPANQNLYITSYTFGNIMELPANELTNHIGDLMVLQTGEASGGVPGLFIVRWDSTISNFVTTSIPVPNYVGEFVEHITFAPIQLPAQ